MELNEAKTEIMGVNVFIFKTEKYLERIELLEPVPCTQGPKQDIILATRLALSEALVALFQDANERFTLWTIDLKHSVEQRRSPGESTEDAGIEEKKDDATAGAFAGTSADIELRSMERSKASSVRSSVIVKEMINNGMY